MTAPTISATEAAELASHLRMTVSRLARRLRQEAEPGITPSLLAALVTIERRGPMTVGDLSAAERVQPPTMTRIAAALVETGLVTREADPDDRRMAWLTVTPKGTKLLQRSRSRKDAYLARRLDGLDEGELAVLLEAAGLLDRLMEADR